MPTGSSTVARCQWVTDAEGRRYTLGRLVGEGGQGVVYEVKEGQLAVKLLRSARGPERERLRRCVQHVKRLDLEGLPIAAPVAVLRPPHIGYLMRLAARMSSLGATMNPPEDGRGISEWYIATGGLRGRLRRLGSIFTVFARLHGRGLVYGDPSPQNILLGSVGDNRRVFLIDADNLHLEGHPSSAGVFTHGYGAPELISATLGPDTLTDAFALAIIAFELLTLVHPFVGDVVHDGEPELEEAAFQGRMPWIEHSSDTRNRCSRGIPRELVISRDSCRLFRRMFEDGLERRLVRPGVAEWAGVFAQAADVTVGCPRCGASYFAPAARECPWCEEVRPALSLAVFHLWDPETNSSSGSMRGEFVTAPTGMRRSFSNMVLAAKEPVRILQRHVVSDMPPDEAEEPVLEATRMREDAIRVINLTKEPIPLMKHGDNRATSELLAAGSERLIPISSKTERWYLHFGALDKLHRAVAFTPLQ